MFTIEKNIEVPKKKEPKYPFKEMMIGDSFFASIKESNALRAAAANYAAKTGKTMKVSRYGDGVRCWRLD